MESSEQFMKPADIRQLANSFQQSRILLSAIELDIFSVLDKKMMTSSSLAEIIKADPRAIDRLMNALVVLGFLRKVHGKFYNTESASLYLVKGKPEFMGGLFHSINLWDNWSTLTKAVKVGTSVVNEEEPNSDVDWSEAFIAAMHYRGVKEAKILAMLLNLSNVNRMLDVGGGSGTFSMELIKVNPKIKSVIFDLPDILPITKKYVAAENMTDKIETIAGNYLVDDLGSGYDLILLSAIVHINSFDENKMLIKKCCDALNCGGQIIIKDWVMNEERTEPESGVFFALNMLVGTERGDTYTEKEMKEWFSNAGISNVERKGTSLGGDLMIGYKS
jgi:hypothetical protein